MKVFKCTCSNTLYFENYLCISCHREVGWCPVCKAIHALIPNEMGGYTCANPECHASLIKCHNYAAYNVCNRMLEASAPEATHVEPLCDYCRFNETIPDLSVAGNKEKWYRLEVAKRRLLYNLDLLELPYGSQKEGFVLPLSFDFKADILAMGEVWKTMGNEERVFTGHANGKITINIREADPVEREKLRVDFGESHRTLIGHFRHEIGHYYWQLLVQDKEEAAFKAIFGDHENPSYSKAMEYYYQNGPKTDWQAAYISAYATMHPWEDFAETWNAYLDMVSVLHTSENSRLIQQENNEAHKEEFNAMVARYLDLGMKINEINRTLGLTDLVPEVFSRPVLEKMRYIHQLIKNAGHNMFKPLSL
jgi:hypothetical protein